MSTDLLSYEDNHISFSRSPSKNEMINNFINQKKISGFSYCHLTGGVGVPGTQKHVNYSDVWVDALSNNITA